MRSFKLSRKSFQSKHFFEITLANIKGKLKEKRQKNFIQKCGKVFLKNRYNSSLKM